MFAIAALVVFILGLILRLLGVGNEWLLLFLGLASSQPTCCGHGHPGPAHPNHHDHS